MTSAHIKFRYEHKKPIPKISVDSNFKFSCYAWLSLVDETFCENCSHFILKWFQAYSFWEMWFLEESYIIKFKSKFVRSELQSFF